MIAPASDRPSAPDEALVGRIEERRTIELHGTAGAGKSRLALAVTLERQDPVLRCALEGFDPPAALAHAIRRGRELDPAKRFASMSAFHEALRPA